MQREGKGNLRLVFQGITGNGNSRSPLVGLRSFVLHIMVVLRSFVLHIMLKNDSSLYDDYQRETRNVTAGTPSCAVLAGI